MFDPINAKDNDTRPLVCVAKEVVMYEYKVICAWCATLMEVKTSDDSRMQGQESHSICLTCKEKMENA